jgi:23S rRNA (adenine2503-C2)-methyltransferase
MRSARVCCNLLALTVARPQLELHSGGLARLLAALAVILQALMQDCAAYFKATGRRVTFEYTLMNGTNDEPEHVSADGGVSGVALL